ncbi:envelope stress response membrane protein PspC [Spirabiliibacterium falconis]|uniref:envelope stress response membrane protein PspC n=1 Tax=Spirabiliibacterium falconis TaxID=572023 RepID=UPI001AADC396|nr:envelope stress response membrane protein PspC [Spirabiliibacterium falconis]MBE2893774.1 envelope stress response membrane protein PspC [Spirabiliibacterium falconis]
MLYRYPQQGMIAGVCAGIAKSSGLEIWVVRTIAVVLFLFGGFFFVPLAYLAGVFMLEKAPDHYFEQPYSQQLFNGTPLAGGQASHAKLAELEMQLSSLKQRVSTLENYVNSSHFRSENA